MKGQASASPSDPRFTAAYILHLDRCVKAFCSDARLEQIPVGNPARALAARFGIKAQEADMEQIEGTIVSLYTNIWRVVGGFQRNYDGGILYEFTYKGKTYRLKRSYRDAITQQVRFESLTVAQFVEAMDAMAIYRAAAARDEKKQYLFTTILTLTACLALAEGETFPRTDSTIRQWINERVVYFEELDMETGFNLLDFFFGTAKPSTRTGHSTTSSIPRSGPRRTRPKQRLSESGR